MPSRRRPAGQRAITRGKIIKLQRAGLLSRNINPDKAPSNIVKNKFYKYRSVISGKQAAVKLSTAKKAAAMRHKIGYGGAGKVVILPREKGEKFRVVKDTITSKRPAYGQTIEKTIGDKFLPPRPGEKVYYTIPARRRGTTHIKRRTFSSFNELLKTFEKYEISFEEVEDYIEVERFAPGSRRERQHRKEYLDARNRLARKRARELRGRRKSKKRKSRRSK